MQNSGEITVSKLFEEIKQKMCDEYCKYPYIKDQEDFEEACERCPLRLL